MGSAEPLIDIATTACDITVVKLKSLRPDKMLATKVIALPSVCDLPVCRCCHTVLGELSSFPSQDPIK
jgi:hypothetical protein